ncbi:hypothetical protein L0Z72_12260 [candidate division KSB1 bacterium]|nr:hypothetical protein [candidate division KSB1 bacterium]
MKNRFDCVAMKHRSAEKIKQKLMDLSLEEELGFWKKRSIELKNKKEKIIKNRTREVNV